MFTNNSKFYAYAYECIHDEVAYGVDFMSPDVDPYDFTEQKSEELKSPCVTIELTGDLANSFDLVDLLEWLKERNICNDDDCNEVAEIYNNSYYADQDEAIFEALNGTAAMEANPFKAIADKIKQVAAKATAGHQMKKGEKQKTTSNLGPIWDKNIDAIKKAIKDRQSIKTVMPPEQVARYYVDLIAANPTNFPYLWALTTSGPSRFAEEIMSPTKVGEILDDAEIKQIVDYTNSTDPNADSSMFEAARKKVGKVIIQNISKANSISKKRIVAGYATDSSLVTEWKNSKEGGQPEVDDTEAQSTWDKLTNAQKAAYLSKFMPNTKGDARLAICNYIINAGGPFNSASDNVKALFTLVKVHDQNGGKPICKLAAMSLISKEGLLSLLAETSVAGLELDKEKTQLDILEAIRLVNAQLKLDFLDIFSDGEDWHTLEEMKTRFENAEGKDEYCLDYADGETTKKISLKQALLIVKGKGKDSQSFSGTGGTRPAAVNSRDKFIQQQTLLLKGLDEATAIKTINQMLRNQKFDALSDAEEATFKNNIKI